MLCVLAALAADCPANPIAHSPCPVCPAEDEKQYIRNATMAILVGDPSDRVALQVGCTAIYCHVLQCSWLPDAAACCCRLMPPPCTAVAPARSCGGRLAPPPPRASPLCCAAAPVLQVTLLITNIARFDAPQPWQQLLPDLLAAAAEDSAVPPAGKQRPLTALKHVLQALKGGCLAGRAPSSCLLHFAAVCCRPGCWRTPTRGLGGCLKSALPLPQRIHPPPTALLLSPFTVCLQARSSSSQHPGTRATCPSRVSALPASTRCRPSHPFSTLPSCPNVQLATFPPSRKPCLTCPCPGCLACRV